MDATWTRYMRNHAPKGILCQFVREGGEPWTGTADFGPLFDVGSLYWRLTAIGRMTLDEMPPQVRAQIEPQSMMAGWTQNDFASSAGCAGPGASLIGSYAYSESWMNRMGFMESAMTRTK